MMYMSPHSAVQRVLEAARKLIAAHDTDKDCGALYDPLRAALADLDSPDSVATEAEANAAAEMYEGPMSGGGDIQVDSDGFALASRGDDGVWVSAWVLVQGPTEAYDTDC